MSGPSAPPPSSHEPDPGQSGGGSAGGDLIEYRLGELERRVGKLEDSISDIGHTMTAVLEQMKSVATKHSIAFWIIGAVVVNFLTLFGHLLIRFIGSD